MKVLLLTGIKEELTPLLGYFSFHFEKKNRVYQSTIYPDLYAATTGPGISKKKEIRKLLKNLHPDIIINAGMVGVLQKEHDSKIGDRVSLNAIRDHRYQIVYPGGKGKNSLVSIGIPVFSPTEKMELALKYSSELCDMEAAKLLEMAGQIEGLRDNVLLVFCKIVGDRPENYDLFLHEKLVRGWKESSFFKKLYLGLFFPGGPYQLKKLLLSKQNGLESLCNHVNRLLQSLIDNQGIHKNIDSIFVPH